MGCRGMIYSGTWHSHRCTKPEWKDGWCKVHHPETVEKRNTEKEIRWKKRRAESIYGQYEVLHNITTELLYDTCDSVHASCDDSCPVYYKNNHQVLFNEDKSNCLCFKDGKKMLNFLLKK